MGITRRYFFVNDDGSLTAVPVGRVDKLYRQDPEASFSELAGQKVSILVAWITVQNRRLVAVQWVEGNYMVFDAEGRMSDAWWHDEMQRAMERYSDRFISRIVGDKKVIEAASRFKDKKDPPSWTVPREMIDQVLKMLRLPWQGYE